MNLSLSVAYYRGDPPDPPMSITLNEEGATIGRRDNNNWVLPDPNKYISGHHATIEFHHPDFYITDTSVNGVFINTNKTPLGRNCTVKLENNDKIIIGEYEISVEIAAIESKKPDTPFPNLGAATNELTFPDDPFADIVTTEPFRGSQPDHVSPLDEAFQSLPDKPAPPIDTKQPNAMRSESQAIPEDWFSFENKKSKSKNLAPEISEPIVQPEPSEVSPLLTGQSELQTEAIRIFLKGAGLDDPDMTDTLDPTTFYRAGKLLRTAIQGTIDVLASRAKIKNEMHLDMTTIHSVQNNPIKFSLSVDEALHHLLAPSEKGYMDPVAATEEAFNDLRAHQIAMLAGMQTALQSILHRFNPSDLELRLQKDSPVGANIPVHKQAKLWRLFEQMYEEIQYEAEDDFNLLFSRTFAKAYEEQINKLQQMRGQATVDHDSDPF